MNRDTSENISNLIEVFASGPFPLYRGRAERISFATAIDEAIVEVKNNVPEKISEKLEQLLINR